MKLSDIAVKFTSARFLMTTGFSFTYCFIMVALTYAMIKKTITVEAYVAILASFVLIVREISDSYFKREDRVSTNGNGNGSEELKK